MANTEFGCLPTIIGSMPFTDPVKAVALVNRFLKDIPAWPQLPRKSFLENMYVQYSEGFPGATIESSRIYIDTSKDYSKALEDLYLAYLNNEYAKYPVGARIRLRPLRIPGTGKKIAKSGQGAHYRADILGHDGNG